MKTHVSNVLAKLEVDDRTQAALYAVKHGELFISMNNSVISYDRIHRAIKIYSNPNIGFLLSIIRYNKVKL